MNKNDTGHLSDAFRWALEASGDASMAAADWLAADIDPNIPSAISLVTGGAATLEQLEQAKDAFKTMRIVGETTADRRLGGRLYLAAIAAALVQHEQRISGQSDAALKRALTEMAENGEIHRELKMLAGQALNVMRHEEPG